MSKITFVFLNITVGSCRIKKLSSIPAHHMCNKHLSLLPVSSYLHIWPSCRMWMIDWLIQTQKV